MYYYILGCGIACLVLFGINSMETVCVKPAEMVGKVLLWPVTLMEGSCPLQLHSSQLQGCAVRRITSEDVEKAIKAAVLFAGTAAFLLYTRGPDVVHCIL